MDDTVTVKCDECGSDIEVEAGFCESVGCDGHRCKECSL